MGKLADRLRELTERDARPLGFRAATVQTKAPQLLLLASIETADGDPVPEGAQGLLAAAGPTATNTALEALAVSAGPGIWGGTLEAGGKVDVERLREAGAHFALLRNTSIAGDALEADDIDKVLEVDGAWPDMLLRTVQQLPIAAALYPLPVSQVLPLQQVLQCRRVATLVGKPLLAVLPPGLGTESLTLLRDAGVAGVVVPSAAVPEFHAAIRDLPPAKRERERMAAVLPVGGPALSHDEEEDDEEE